MCLTLLLSGSLAYKANAESILFQDKLPPTITATKFTELTINKNDKNIFEHTFSGQDIPVKDLFGKIVEKITWDNKNKVAIIESNGKSLVLGQSGQYVAKNNQLVLPRGWSYLKDGRTFIHLPYLAYVFNRYGNYTQNSEEIKWQKNLEFLNIEYIDTNDSSPKDQTVHSFINIKNIKSK